MLTLLLAASRECGITPVARARLVRCSAVPELSAEERLALNDPGGLGGSTYGEITPAGFRTLMASCELGSSDSFVDLGSGRGACVLQAASEYHVCRATGVELAPSRHNLAVAALAASKADVRSRTSFILGDIGAPEAASALSGDSTVVWLSNLLFDAELMQRIARMLEAAPTVRCVAGRALPAASKGSSRTTRPFPPRCHGPTGPCWPSVRYLPARDRWVVAGTARAVRYKLSATVMTSLAGPACPL